MEGGGETRGCTIPTKDQWDCTKDWQRRKTDRVTCCPFHLPVAGVADRKFDLYTYHSRDSELRAIPTLELNKHLNWPANAVDTAARAFYQGKRVIVSNGKSVDSWSVDCGRSVAYRPTPVSSARWNCTRNPHFRLPPAGRHKHASDLIS